MFSLCTDLHVDRVFLLGVGLGKEGFSISRYCLIVFPLAVFLTKNLLFFFCCSSTQKMSFLPSCCCHDHLYVWFSAVGVYVVYVCVCALSHACVLILFVLILDSSWASWVCALISFVILENSQSLFLSVC